MGLVNPRVYTQPSVDSLLREAARQFIAERRDFTNFHLDSLFARLATEAFDAERCRHRNAHRLSRRLAVPPTPDVPSGR